MTDIGATANGGNRRSFEVVTESENKQLFDQSGAGSA